MQQPCPQLVCELLRCQLTHTHTRATRTARCCAYGASPG
jgi:hypothetical protein